MIIRCDYHVHSRISPDGHSPMTEMCDAALLNGLTEIAFTDHYECYSMGVRSRNFDEACADRYFAELEECRKAYDGRIRVLAGVELGQSHLNRDEALRLLSRPYDYVLGSVHKLGNVDLSLIRLTENSRDLIGDTYYEYLYEMAVSGEYDCIGHLDYFKKQCAKCSVGYSFERYESRVRDILNVVIERGKGLEINTACLDSVPGPAAEETMPDMDILRIYKELGGSIVTAGSDAHRADRIGYGFERAAEKLKKAGIDHLSRYRRRQVHTDIQAAF